MVNKLEDRVRRYIKMKKFFIFSDALIVTGLSKDQLLKVLDRLEKEGLIIQDRDEKSIMKKPYVVILKRNNRVLTDEKRINLELIKSVNKVIKVLESNELESCFYSELFSNCKLSKGVFAKIINILVKLKILIEDEKEFTTKQNRSFKIDRNLLIDLLTFYKQKKYYHIQEILDDKKPLRYVAVPKDLTQVLNVIIGNEILKRDELAHQSKITRKRLSDWWQILKKLGIIIDSFKESDEDRVSYIFSSKRAKIVLGYVNDGAYEKDKELKHLWTH